MNHCRTFTLFSKSLPLDVASRVWDVFCRDGEAFLFRAALGEFLKLFKNPSMTQCYKKITFNYHETGYQGEVNQKPVHIDWSLTLLLGQSVRKLKNLNPENVSTRIFFFCSHITFFITHPTLHFQSWLGNWCKFQALFWEHTLNIHCTCPPVFLGNPECKILILFISQEYWSFIRRICWKWISFILASFFPSYQMTYLQLLFSK